MTDRLELFNITKRYPGVIANDAITLGVAAGEIHAILGENGAGKSTLMKIIYGAVTPDGGEIRFEGEILGSHSPGHSRHIGIEMVYQHFSLFETVTVAENIALCQDGRLNLKALGTRIEETADRYGLTVDPAKTVFDLSVGERQQVEILRCLLQKPKLLILDEPTSVLAPQSVDQLFDVLRALARDGCSILYISHKLDEVRALCDSATVLRNGKVTGDVDPRKATSHELAVMMVGSDLPMTEMPETNVSVDPVLSVTNLSAAPFQDKGRALSEINLDVHAGEVVGIAGVSGNGQTELSACLSGEAMVADDAIKLGGANIGHLSPDRRRRLGLAYVPEERLGRGAVPSHSLTQNALLTAYVRDMVRGGMVNGSKAREFAGSVVDRYSVKTNGIAAQAGSLSGGNLQKFILGRELSLEPRVLIAAQPTWGVDVGAASFVRQKIVDLSRNGAGVLIISEELEELLEICDRIHVLSDGRLSAAIPRSEATREKLGLNMGGSTLHAPLLERKPADAVPL